MTKYLFLVGAMTLAILALDSPRVVGQSSLDPGHKETVEVNGVRFSSPRGFSVDPQQSSDGFRLLRHDEYDLVVFVALLASDEDADDVRGSLARVAAALNPKGATDYRWKKVEDSERVSRFESAGALVQGFNGSERIGVQYRLLRKDGSAIVVGYGWVMGRGKDQRRPFDENLGGDSMSGWYAQAHVVSSITGEPYDTLNPPGGGIAAPPPPGARRD